MSRSESIQESQIPTRSTGIFASLAAIGTAILASGCCLPLLPFVAAAGAAGSSAVLTKLRPLLLVLSLGFVALGFYQGWRAKKCGRRRSTISTILLWSSASIVVAFVFFPQLIANLIATLSTKVK